MSYNTIPTMRGETTDKTKLAGVVALACVTLGFAVGFVGSAPATGLYAPVATQPVVRPITHMPIPSRHVMTHMASANDEMAPAAGGEASYTVDGAQPHRVPSSPRMGAIVGGFAMTALAAVASFALGRKATNKPTHDPLGITSYENICNAEAEWAMMTSTSLVGNQAPDFTATAVFDEEFVEIKLSDYRGSKYVVLFFYPLDFTFVCPTEITAFSDRYEDFAAIDTEILGVSVDSQFSHLAWVQTPRNQGGLGEINYPLVADLKKEIAEAFGVLVEEEGVALRGLFIIDKEGVIQHATINNLSFGRNVDETLRVLEAVQHVQANPDEVCPAGWKKGDKTMKPDPEGSKEYFSAI